MTVGQFATEIRASPIRQRLRRLRRETDRFQKSGRISHWLTVHALPQDKELWIQIDATSVDAERNDVAASKRLSVINPVTGKQLAAVPDVDRTLLNKAISAARNAFSGWGAVPFERRKAVLASLLNKIDNTPMSCAHYLLQNRAAL